MLGHYPDRLEKLRGEPTSKNLGLQESSFGTSLRIMCVCVCACVSTVSGSVSPGPLLVLWSRSLAILHRQRRQHGVDILLFLLDVLVGLDPGHVAVAHVLAMICLNGPCNARTH